MQHYKNYIGFLTDHSSSMNGLQAAALKDYNTNIEAVKSAASANMLDTIVSSFGFGGLSEVTKHIVNSNPNVLTPMKEWKANGNTPLYDAIGDMIALFKSMPDYNNPSVSFLIMCTTDGEEYRSQRYTCSQIATLIKDLSKDERWTFVMRVSKGYRDAFDGLNIPFDNIQEWDTSVKGMEASTQATTQAMNTYYTLRSTGKRGSSTFYANAANVSAAQVKANLKDISAEVSLWTVMPDENGAEIRPFAEKRLGSMPFLKGAAFYQLTKTETRVQDNKEIIIRDKSTGHVYSGADARNMIGLPPVGTVRLHPGDHGNYDIFIQSTSINRKLVAGTQVLYWPKIGVGFTADDFPWLKNGQTENNPSLVQKAAEAIQATASVKPVYAPNTVSHIYFPSRDDGRMAAKTNNKPLKDAGPTAPKGQRWYI